MHAFDILGDPVRRRIIELLGEGTQSAGEIGAVVEREFKISQPAVSQHLRVLRDAGFATVRAEGTRRLYAVDPTPLMEIVDWVDKYRRYWTEGFDSLDAHLAKMTGKRDPRAGVNASTSSTSSATPSISTGARARKTKRK
jgi:DNA-binding transcriptional ArsR family regulator